jgi:phage/plasmid-like protein (TIGR03299 family)
MSRETITWLNTMTLIGNTDQRGTAWHYRARSQGEESNHYPGPIPVADVERRLFAWRAVERRVAVEFPATPATMTHLGEGGEPLRWAVQQDRKAVAPDDAELVMGMFKDGYKIHQYRQWLLTNVAAILGEDLAVSSAGLLRDRAVAWVEVSMPETITTPAGVQFRPNLLSCTSFDGSLSTTYKRTVQLTVCDNTMGAALGERGQAVKVKHSRNSLNRIADVREALAMVHATAESFTADVERLTAAKVSGLEFRQVLDAMVPIAQDASARTRTSGINKRQTLTQLYNFDPRVAPWKGTAFGVVQAFNTWHHHEQNGLSGNSHDARRQARADRNAMRAITGETEKNDAEVLRVLADLLAL